MNRRGLLALLGFAPIAGVAAALPRADNPNAMLKKVIEKADLPVGSIKEIACSPFEFDKPFIFEDGTLYLSATNRSEVGTGPLDISADLERRVLEIIHRAKRHNILR